MEERRVSKGVIRRRASRTEPEETKGNLAEAAPENISLAEKQESGENLLAPAGVLTKEHKKTEPPHPSAAEEMPIKEKENAVKSKKVGKKEEAQKPDVLSVIKTLDNLKVKSISSAAESASHKKPVKKEEIKKGPQAKFSKNEKFIDTSEEGESFIFRKHKRKFGGKFHKQPKRVQQIVPEKRRPRK